MMALGMMTALIGIVLIDTNIDHFKTAWLGAVGYVVVMIGAALVATAVGA